MQAIELLNRSIIVGANLAEAYYLRGICKYELEDFIGAERDLNKAIEENPKNNEAFLYRGVCRSRLLKFKEAFEDYGKAQQLNAKDERVYSNRALANLHLERFVDAIADCNEVIQLKKESSFIYLIRGESKVGLDMYKVAIEDFDKAHRLDSLDMLPVLHRGMAHTKLKEFDAAIADLTFASSMDTQNVLPVFHRGVAYLEMNEDKKALADFNYVLNRFPDNAAALFHRAMVYAESKRVSDALTDYTTVIRLNPNNILGYFNRGILKHNAKDYKGALEDYDKAIRLFPEFLEAYENSSQIYRFQGRFDDYKRCVSEMERIQREMALGDDDVKMRQHIRLMKATELKSTFQPLGQEVGRLQYQNVDIRLLPYYRITLFPDGNHDLRVYDGYHRPNYNTGVISLISHKDEAGMTSMMKRFNELSRSNRPDTKGTFEMGLLSIDLGWFEDGLLLMDSAIASEPDQANYYLGRAILRQRVLDELLAQHQEMMGELVDVVDTVFEIQVEAISDLAATDLNKVITLDPEMTFAHYNLGYLLAASEKYDEAVGSFTKAIICKDDFIEAYYNRGLLRLLLGETREGCEDLSRAGELGMTDAYNVIKRYCE